MKFKITSIILSLFIFSFLAQSQNFPKDSIFGNIKKVREKVIFLTKIENPQFLYNDDYGHSGFMGPRITILKFYDTWYKTNFCYYLNYERHFDKKRNIIKDIWFEKKDSIIHSYKYLYDEKERLKSTIDSSGYSIDTENHYYTEYENQLYENIMNVNSFSHTLIKYVNKKKIQLKRYDSNGNLDEYKYYYNENGKPISRTYKHSYNWIESGENPNSYRVHDSICTEYKDKTYEYDTKNRLIKSQHFNWNEQSKTSVIGRESTYTYQGDNLIRISTGDEITNFTYDKYGKPIEEYYYNKNINYPRMNHKYTYKDGKIIKLEYSEKPSESDKMKTDKIAYAYKFDDNKNWIEITKTVNGVKLYKWIREIEYY